MRWSCRLGWGPEMLSLVIVEEFGPWLSVQTGVSDAVGTWSLF